MNIGNELLCNEKNVIIEACRLTSVDGEKLKKMIDDDFDWEKMIEYAIRNKALYLVVENLKKYNCLEGMPRSLQVLIIDALRCNKLRNKVKFLELQKVCTTLEKQGIVIAPVKGAYMIENVYRNQALRMTNDIDALIEKKDIPIINQIMHDLGYSNKKYDENTNSFIERTREQYMLYKTKMYNLLPYIRVVDEPIDMQVIFDFSHALDFSLSAAPIHEMLEMSKWDGRTRKLLPEHYFIHMCCHHYREASHVEWLRIGQDLNLIKFCDVRELILNKLSDVQMQNAIDFAHKHKLQKAVYFVLYFLSIIYNDGYEESLMEQLQIQNDDFVFMFGEDEDEKKNIRKKDFWDSFFDSSNSDEIRNIPKYDKVMK